MILSEAGEAFLLHCRLERQLSANTLVAYRQDVAELVGHFCVSAWNKAPVFGVIGVQTGPQDN